MARHFVEPNEKTLHGAFSRDLAPVLTIDPGDTVRFRTLDAAWNLEPRTSTRRDEPPKQFTPRPEGHDGHALCGPVAIRGAMPGATLAVRVDALCPGRWGYTGVGGFPHPLNTRLGVFAEFERDILRDRVKAGIAQARKEGRPHGRPATVAKHAQEIKRLF